MKIRRTACAGVLLELDGKQFLMDGVGREVKPYPATPPEIRRQLEADPPDALLLTHRHADHYDSGFVSQFRENAPGPILGPGDIPLAEEHGCNVGNVKIMSLESRHIGKPDGTAHRSFILQGSSCVWFSGDASPLQWKARTDLPKPDVMIVPYAYAMGSGWELCKSLGPKAVILLHLPEQSNDPYCLWQAVEAAAGRGGEPALYIPAMGETLSLAGRDA